VKRDDRVLRAVIAGFLVGLIGGLLLAPASGEETRRRLKRRAERFAGDLTDRVEGLSAGIGERVEGLKQVAKDLSSEAKEESGELIARAEVLKTDLQDSTTTLREAGRGAAGEVVGQVRSLMDEGATVMDELERLTKRLVGSAKTKLRQRPNQKSDLPSDETDPEA